MADARKDRRVLIVAPSFAPVSNPPTQRVRFFARHLPDYGWTPTVLSVEPRFYEERADPDIDALLPPDLTVLRTRALPTRWTRRLGVGDVGIRGYPYLRRALRTLCEGSRPDLVFIPGPPWHTFLLGPEMQRRYGVPYVLDYIDPWISSMGADGRWWRKAYWHRRTSLLLEPRAARHAAHLVGVSDGTVESVRARYPEIPPERCTAIPYGVEPDDFAVLGSRPRPREAWMPEPNAVHVVYAGAMLPQGYETLRALFAGVLQLRAQQPAYGARLRLHFVGTTYEPNPRAALVLPVAREMGLGDQVTEHPARVPYLDALDAIARAQIILALGSSEPHYTASKIYPSIFARRPILAVFHAASSVCDVMRAAQAGELVTYDERNRADAHVGEIAAALRRLGEHPEAYISRVRWDAVQSYTASALTGRLAAVFDQCVAPRTAPGRTLAPVSVG